MRQSAEKGEKRMKKIIGNSRRRRGPYWKQPIDLTDHLNSALEPDSAWSKEEEFEIAQFPLDRDFPELFSEINTSDI